MGRIPDHRRIPGFEVALDAYCAGEGGLQQLECFLDDKLDVHWNALTETAAAESENAINERSGAPGRMHDVIEVAAQGSSFRGLLVRELAVPDDGSQDVV